MKKNFIDFTKKHKK